MSDRIVWSLIEVEEVDKKGGGRRVAYMAGPPAMEMYPKDLGGGLIAIRIGAVSSHYGEGGLRAREHDGGPVVRGAGAAAAAAADGFRWRKEAAEDAAAAAGRHGEAGQQTSGAAASATGAVVAVPVAGGCGAVCAAEEGGGGDGLGDGVGAVTTLGFALHFPLSGPSRMTSPSSVLCESNKVRTVLEAVCVV
ncbi:hypothetical protein GW17_00007225 [Ensete ventricosum]|nr:hypothetical protein GW17_00007225 [Ensete ventricosum]